MAYLEFGDGGEIHRRVIPDGRVRTPARLDANHLVSRQCIVAHEKLRVFARIDVVRHDRDREFAAEPLAKSQRASSSRNPPVRQMPMRTARLIVAASRKNARCSLLATSLWQGWPIWREAVLASRRLVCLER